jgi:hypothetical protein
MSWDIRTAKWEIVQQPGSSNFMIFVKNGEIIGIVLSLTPAHIPAEILSEAIANQQFESSRVKQRS